jgi:glucokinase
MNEMAIAADIGGSHVGIGIQHEDRVIATETIRVRDTTLKAVLPELELAIRGLVAKAGVEMRQMTGVALGICAIADGASTVFAANGKYDDAVGFDFTRWSEASFGLTCRVENDSRLALLGEHFAGAAKGYDDAVMVTLGTGIGGAVMLGGKLLQSGGHKAGGLAGHLGVAWNGRTCSCGNRGCAETEGSTAFLDANCREREGFANSSLATAAKAIDFRMVFEAADAGDTFAQAVLDRCIGVWSALTVTLVHAYDPKVIVFGGEVMQRHESILSKIQKYVDRHTYGGSGSTKIVPAALGSSAALLGALPLLRSRA